MLEKLFRLKQAGTSVRTELLAGLATFLTMAYITIVNPLTLSTDGTGMAFGKEPQVEMKKDGLPRLKFHLKPYLTILKMILGVSISRET